MQLFHRGLRILGEDIFKRHRNVGVEKVEETSLKVLGVTEIDGVFVRDSFEFIYFLFQFAVLNLIFVFVSFLNENLPVNCNSVVQ
jgi:hypothetical protein